MTAASEGKSYSKDEDIPRPQYNFLKDSKYVYLVVTFNAKDEFFSEFLRSKKFDLPQVLYDLLLSMANPDTGEIVVYFRLIKGTFLKSAFAKYELVEGNINPTYLLIEPKEEEIDYWMPFSCIMYYEFDNYQIDILGYVPSIE